MADDRSESDPDHFEKLSSKFLEWFQSNPGTRLSAETTLADLRSRNAGRGVVANTDISADEELFAVPRSLVLRKTNSELYSKVPASFTDLGPWDSLILVIVYEYLRNASSPWFPYLRLLPTTFDTLMFWTPQELSELQGSAVVDKIGKEQAEESWRTTILPIMLSNEGLFPLPFCTAKQKERQLIELAHMAGSMIMAYAFDLDEDDSNESVEDMANEVDSDLTEDDEHNPSKGMVPFADMLNADAHRNNARLFHEDDFLIMKATKDIKAGDEIFNDYGPLPRSDLLRMYGYITDNYSAFDVVEMSAGLIENVAASSGTERSYLGRAREELESLCLIDDTFTISRPDSGSKLEDTIPADLRMLITAFCLPAEKFNPSKLSKHVRDGSFALSEASLLQTSITKRLGDFKSSLQADFEILGKLKNEEDIQLPDGVCRKRCEMAVQVRKGEKEILHHILQLIQDFVAEQTRRMAGDSAKRKWAENDTAASNKKKATHK